MSSIKDITVYYCENCNIPVLVEESTTSFNCPKCNHSLRYISTDARPVYPEERLMLEASIGKPLKFIKDDVWNIKGSKYIINGQILDIKVRDIVK